MFNLILFFSIFIRYLFVILLRPNIVKQSVSITCNRTDILFTLIALKLKAECITDIFVKQMLSNHYSDVIVSTMTPQITSLTVVYSIVYSDADQRKHQSPVSLAFVRGIHRSPMNSPHKGPVTRKMFPFDDVIMSQLNFSNAGPRHIRSLDIQAPLTAFLLNNL